VVGFADQREKDFQRCGFFAATFTRLTSATDGECARSLVCASVWSIRCRLMSLLERRPRVRHSKGLGRLQCRAVQSKGRDPGSEKTSRTGSHNSAAQPEHLDGGSEPVLKSESGGPG
jgi:hypothetical protein